jgi:hypothetical protein
VDISFSLILLHLEFTLNFSIIFIGSLNVRASREAYTTEVNIPEICFSSRLRYGEVGTLRRH